MHKPNSRVGNSNSWSNSMGKRSMSNKRSISIGRDSIILNISNITIIAISSVAHSLETTIRKSNRVFTRYSTSTISSLSSIKARSRIVIIDGICVGVREGFIRIGNSSMSNSNWSMCN